jgi:hypothetical protein
MNYNLRFHEALNGDLLGAFHWYEEKSAGLGDELLQIFYNHAESIARSPFR